ncbi:unnamed protein product [Paramecium octaurelia]|uniref:Uncharacterized protein n=1 Tax=Paramecium octaurelia TaxID=43137 RepID=A0A8S1X4W7_PAROT|nr:unnamed protein product [Paramecium octaurelia]
MDSYIATWNTLRTKQNKINGQNQQKITGDMQMIRKTDFGIIFKIIRKQEVEEIIIKKVVKMEIGLS